VAEYIVSAHICPRCGGHDLHHSRLRNWVEKTRGRLTGFVPFRCHTCDWRGWRSETRGSTAAELRQVHRELTEAELDQLDPGRRPHGV
jgi:hypothetical protein